MIDFLITLKQLMIDSLDLGDMGYVVFIPNYKF
jgi:hypothetical protein